MKKRLIFFLLLTTFLYPVSAQTSRLYTSELGLPNSQINRICQDGHDFLWVCTEGGLLRFDGVSFEEFRHDQNNDFSLLSDSVHDFCEDGHGVKWVGTASGLAIFDSEHSRFSRFDLQDSRQPDSRQFIGKLIMVPGRTGNNLLFVITGGSGIYVIDTGQQTVLNDKREKIYASVPDEHISAALLDAGRRLWIVPDRNGLPVILNVDTLDPCADVRWDPDLVRAADGIRITALAEDPVTRNLLIGTDHGLLVFDNATHTVRRARGKNAGKTAISSAIFNNQARLEDGRSFLLGDENGGLLLFDIATEEVRPGILPSMRSTSDNWKATVMFEDNQGNVWLGLYQNGLLVAPKSMFGFSYLGFDKNGIPGQNSACVMSLYDDGRRLWVGTDGAGLFCTEPGGKQTNYNKDNSGLTNNAVMCVEGDKHGNLWIGTYLDGLFYKDAGGKIRLFPEQGGIGTMRIRTLEYDEKRDLLYVGTYGAGLVVIDPARLRIVQSVVDEEYLWISALHLDKSGLLWVGTYNGPFQFEAETGLIVPFHPDMSSARIYSIASDDDGNIWFGTGDGLFCTDAEGSVLMHYNEKSGLANNVIRDIVPSQAGNVWISTAGGLSRLNTRTGVLTSFHVTDGLQSNEFRSGAVARSASGLLYFGGTSGVTAFSPRLVDGNGHKVPQVFLSRLRELERDIEYDPNLGNANLIDKHISEATRILVPTGTDLFSLTFSVPEYTNPMRIAYACRLRGFDSDWKTIPARHRTATYTNVPPGRYTFEVKAYFEGMPEEYSMRSIDIQVEAPWYRTRWAYAVYLLLLSAVGYALYRLWRRREQRKQEMKDAELKELRLGLFTNLTHEIRTPLTLVMGPLRTLRESEQDPAQKDTYNLMYRNCLRINRLVNQLMDLRKVDAGQMPMHFRRTDLVYFIRDIMKSFFTMAKSKDIHFTMSPAREEEFLWIDQGNFDKIIYNILSNAFKHTPEGGRIHLSISEPIPNRNILQADVREYVEISVFNSGSKIEDSYISRVFDRFVQIDPYDANTGSGVGLNLAKMLVELHHGTIEAENLEDGVVFRVRIPAGKDHLTEAELVETTHHKDLYDRMADTPEARLEEETLFVPTEEGRPEKTLKARKNLLVVEDDEETREYLRKLLRGKYNVTVCANGKEAWPVVSTTLPDAVITDLVMPEMNGRELCVKIRQNPSTNHIPVIVLTGQDSEKEQEEASESGADKFLSKPVSVSLLLSSIAQVISARETVKGKFAPAMEYDYTGIKMGSADEALMRRIVESIHTHLENPDFDVAALCADVGISRVHLNRKLKENGNVPPSTLIKSFRMKQAAYLLANNQVNVSEVAYRVGYASHSYFSSTFKDFFGMTPREFVSRYIDNPDDSNLKKLFE
jgi:signal transduction histidine kinase/ligand-binding sensor domain-containing protein/AraC-like DNA-binding protein